MRIEAAAPDADQRLQAACQQNVTERWRAQFLKDCQLGFVRALGTPDEDAALLGALEQIGLSVNGTEVRFWEADARGVVRLRVVWSRAGHDATTQPSTQAAPPALVTKVISSRELSFSRASPAHPVGESLGVPVLKGDHALGAIEISAPDFAGFDDVHAAHLTALGNYLGIDCAQRRSAADFARSLEELNHVSGERLRLMRLLVEAHEDERRTIAADIHDDSLQILAAGGLRLQTLRRRVNDEAARSTLDAVGRMVGVAVSRLRGLMFNLRPTGLDHGDLLGTIRDRVTQGQQDEGIETNAELRTLKEIGVTQGQVFLIARPVVPPIDERRILERLGV
jgi:signal transduction histidine kinase